MEKKEQTYWFIDILTETSKQNEFNYLYFLQFCIKCNQIWHKQQINYDTIEGNDKVLTSHIVHSTQCRHKRGVHSNNTSSDFALEVSFSLYTTRLEGVSKFKDNFFLFLSEKHML